MKVYLCMLGCLLLPVTASSQPSVRPVSDVDVAYLLSKVELLGEVRTASVSIRILRIDCLPGSAGGESGEVTQTLYVVVWEDDELPETRAYRIDGLYNASLVAFEEDRSQFVIEYGGAEERKRFRGTVDGDDVLIVVSEGK